MRIFPKIKSISGIARQEISNVWYFVVPPKFHKTADKIVSHLPAIISGALVLTFLGFYFFDARFRLIVQEGWQVLSSGNQRNISAWVSEFGFWGPLFIIAFMIVQMFAVVINVTALMVVAVLAYGPVWGSVISLIGIFIASTVGYLIGRFLGKAAVTKLIGKKTSENVQEKVHRYGLWAVVIARISPMISNDAISFVAGLANMGFGKFMLATAAGIIPLMLLIAYLGENIDRLKSGLIWVSVVGIAALIILYIYDHFKHKKKKQNPGSD